jgi:hypothetical protein
MLKKEQQEKLLNLNDLDFVLFKKKPEKQLKKGSILCLTKKKKKSKGLFILKA